MENKPAIVIPYLKPPPLFLLRSRGRTTYTDRDVLRRANTKLVFAGVPRPVLFRRYLGWFYRFPFQLYTALRKHGVSARDGTDREIWRQALDIVRVGLSSNIDPRTYYKMGLFRTEDPKTLDSYISNELYFAPVMAALRARRDSIGSGIDLKSKLDFERYCRTHGFPSAETVAIVSQETLLDLDKHPIDDAPAPGDLFVKPVRAGQGRGTLLLRQQAHNRYSGPDGEARSLPEHASRIRQDAVANDWFRSRVYWETGAYDDKQMLIQMALRNHEDVLARVGPAFATCRIITIRNEKDDPEVVFAAFRSASNIMRVVDNYHSEGIAFPVDIETGQLRAGRFLDYIRNPRFHEQHPATSAQMAGWRLPDWSKASDLAFRLHQSFPELLLAGWDIGFTAAGPFVVEVNAPPGLPLVQIERGFLGTRYSQLVAHHVSKWLDEGNPQLA